MDDPRPDHNATGSKAAVRRVLLATDLSAASGRAAGEAIGIAFRSDAHLLVFSVIDPGRLRLPGGRFLRRVDQERSRVEAGVQHLVRQARAAGVNATFLVWEGDPADAIIAAAEAEDADFIVLGSRGRSSLGRILLGSTSSRVAETATCPVQVVPG
jgi:nucleotide-binding universal stress UspA family protein